MKAIKIVTPFNSDNMDHAGRDAYELLKIYVDMLVTRRFITPNEAMELANLSISAYKQAYDNLVRFNLIEEIDDANI